MASKTRIPEGWIRDNDGDLIREEDSVMIVTPNSKWGKATIYGHTPGKFSAYSCTGRPAICEADTFEACLAAAELLNWGDEL